MCRQKNVFSVAAQQSLRPSFYCAFVQQIFGFPLLLCWLPTLKLKDNRTDDILRCGFSFLWSRRQFIGSNERFDGVLGRGFEYYSFKKKLKLSNQLFERFL